MSVSSGMRYSWAEVSIYGRNTNFPLFAKRFVRLRSFGTTARHVRPPEQLELMPG
jgi:hypothetical protein